MKVERFEDLTIFKKARELCKKVYSVTEKSPFCNDLRFVQQMHASAGSIMDNIAEGFERSGNKDFVNFLIIAKGSCGEVRSQIIRASDVNFISNEMAKEMYDDCLSLSSQIMSLVKEIRKSEYKGVRYKDFEP